MTHTPNRTLTKPLQFAVVATLCFSSAFANAGVISKKLPIGRIAVGLGVLALIAKAPKSDGCQAHRDPEKGLTGISCAPQASPIEEVVTDKSSTTRELRKALNEDRESRGLPPDPEDCDAHHIVPKSENRTWAKDNAELARKTLASCGIDIDSAANGIFLPSKLQSNNCSGSYHKTLHTSDYYSNVAGRLSGALLNGSCDDVSSELNSIKVKLMFGEIW